jgi:hypothetical protein
VRSGNLILVAASTTGELDATFDTLTRLGRPALRCGRKRFWKVADIGSSH